MSVTGLMIEPKLFTTVEWATVVERVGLTPRQAEIAGLIVDGRSDQEIARELAISPNTVRAHLQRTFELVGVNDRTSLVVLIFRTFRECYDCVPRHCGL